MIPKSIGGNIFMTHNAPRIRSEGGGKLSLPQAESAESAGCEAPRAELPADVIRGTFAPADETPSFTGGGREQIWLIWFSQAEGHRSANNTDLNPTRPVAAAWVNQHLILFFCTVSEPPRPRAETAGACSPSPARVSWPTSEQVPGL
jgi:hypothetical protein